MPLNYVVKRGDTLNRIAARYQTTAQAIFSASSFRSGDINLIYPGEIAVIPTPEAAKTEPDIDSSLPDSDEIHVRFGDEVFAGWTGATVNLALDDASRSFSIAAPFDPSQALGKALRPFSYQPVTIYAGNRRVLTGTIDKQTYSFGESGREVTLQGRSKTGALVDCSILPELLSLSGLTLGRLARRYCEAFGIEVILSGPDTEVINEARPEPGDSVFDYLKKCADPRKRLLYDDSRGRLVIASEPEPTSDPVATFVEGQDAFGDVVADYDGTLLFSRYIVFAQVAGNPSVRGEVSDSTINAVRPFVKVNKEGGFATAEAAAQWERAMALSSAHSLSFFVPGWRNATGIWQPRDAVTVKCPSVAISEEIRYMIRSVALQITGSERSATLSLVLPDTYTGRMPGVTPWT